MLSYFVCMWFAKLIESIILILHANMPIRTTLSPGLILVCRPNIIITIFKLHTGYVYIYVVNAKLCKRYVVHICASILHHTRGKASQWDLTGMKGLYGDTTASACTLVVSQDAVQRIACEPKQLAIFEVVL